MCRPGGSITQLSAQGQAAGGGGGGGGHPGSRIASRGFDKGSLHVNMGQLRI